MEFVDNAIMLWDSLTVALLIAAAVADPVNRLHVRRGCGHAVVRQYH